LNVEPEIDARGLKCPEPVIRTKRMIESACGPFTVLVDNPTARDNVQRFAHKADCDVRVSEHQDGFLLEVTPGTSPSEAPAAVGGGSEKVIFISADEIGKGDPELGRTLMKMFLYALTEGEEVPSTIVFANSGVRLVTENEETVAHVKSLEESGARVLVCGTCLDFYGLTGSLKAGRVSNMYDIQQALIGASLLVSL
jgi:selenium metabolism protein YedF